MIDHAKLGCSNAPPLHGGLDETRVVCWVVGTGYCGMASRGVGTEQNVFRGEAWIWARRETPDCSRGRCGNDACGERGDDQSAGERRREFGEHHGAVSLVSGNCRLRENACGCGFWSAPDADSRAGVLPMGPGCATRHGAYSGGREWIFSARLDGCDAHRAEGSGAGNSRTDRACICDGDPTDTPGFPSIPFVPERKGSI